MNRFKRIRVRQGKNGIIKTHFVNMDNILDVFNAGENVYIRFNSLENIPFEFTREPAAKAFANNLIFAADKQHFLVDINENGKVKAWG